MRQRKLNRKNRKGKGLEPAQTIWMQDSTYKITRILFREFGTGREFDARFSDFRNVDLPEGVTQQITVPFVLTYSIKAEKNYTISLEYSKASANKPQTFPFTIPEGYERIK